MLAWVCTISYCVLVTSAYSCCFFSFLIKLRPFSFSDQGSTFRLFFGASECRRCYPCNGVTTQLKMVDMLWYHHSWCKSRDRKATGWDSGRRVDMLQEGMIRLLGGCEPDNERFLSVLGSVYKWKLVNCSVWYSHTVGQCECSSDCGKWSHREGSATITIVFILLGFCDAKDRIQGPTLLSTHSARPRLQFRFWS